MPRPKTVSDERVLEVALTVLAEKGPSFTLTDIADGVGLSRATLIQRFGDRAAILRRLAVHQVEATRIWLDSLPVQDGPAGLWSFLETIVGSMGAGDGFNAHLVFATIEAQDETLRALAGQRYDLVCTAIAQRLPEQAERERLARHLHALIAGASMQWIASDRRQGLADYVLATLRFGVEHLGLDRASRSK